MLFAHTQNEDNTNEAQPLFEHALHVAKYMQHNLQSIELGTIGFLIGFLHDLGKATQEWQNYLLGTSSRHPSHAHYGRVLYNEQLFANADDDFKFILSNVILGHHSNLFDAVSNDDIEIFGKKFDTASLEFALHDWAAQNEQQDFDTLSELLTESPTSMNDFNTCAHDAQEEFAQWKEKSLAHLQEIDPDNLETRYAIYKSLLQMLLLSSLNDADTLDTQRHHDNIEFQYDAAPDWMPYVTDIEQLVASFQQKREIDFIRQEISDSCYADAFKTEETPGIKKLSAPTGCGKTLCSTRYAFNYAHANDKRKVFYIIPFTTIIDQNAQVICDLLRDSSNVLVHHSNVVTENDDINESSPNKRLSATRYTEDVILTTQVRFLDGVFGSSRSSNKLFCRYVDSVVIFDEFQSMPEKVIDMFYALVDFMASTMKCDVVLCSATQTASMNVPIETELISGRDWEAEYRDKFRRTVYEDRVSYDKEETPAETIVYDAAGRSESTLVITNTKRQAEELFMSIAACYADTSDVDVFYLSTNMYMVHRKRTLEAINESLANPGKVTILVSTSLIEAGVDISFKNCIRYENGLEHVIQSGGRCNRNGEWDKGTVYIVREPREIVSRGYADQKYALMNALQYASENECVIEGALDAYYNEYLKRIGESTKYETSSYGYLYDLLACNPKYVSNEECKAMLGILPCLPPNTSILRTVRSLFHTIDDQDQMPIFIALEESAKELLRQFENAKTYSQLGLVQKRMQQYSVNVYTNQQRLTQLLERADNEALDVSVLYVDSEYLYSPKVGLTASSSALGDVSAIVL